MPFGIFSCYHNEFHHFSKVLIGKKSITTYSKTCVKRPLSERPQIGFQDQLMQVKSIAECSPWSILQYFQPTLSYRLSLRPLFCLFLSGRFTQVLLYRKN